ncbi:MAG: ABC transporter ATP-binding protein [Chloroflexota bacterium]
MVVSLDSVSVHFPAGDGDGTIAAVGPASFDVEAGSFVALLGPSGSGKSTLIRAVAGLQAVTTGRILIDGELITEPHKSVGMMFQDATLMPWRDVRENIALPLEIEKLPEKEKTQRINTVLNLLGLADFGDAYPGELSGGMAQRVALGRALVQRPQILLLDEPFGALDALTRERISLDLLRIWAEFKQTIIMVTHDINEAVLLSNRVIVLSSRPGRVIADIDVPLMRPRTIDMIYTDAFVKIAREVRQAIDRA